MGKACMLNSDGSEGDGTLLALKTEGRALRQGMWVVSKRQEVKETNSFFHPRERNTDLLTSGF